MSNAISLAKELQSMKAIDVIRNERVRNQFISVYNSIWKEGGEQVYEREAIYFNQQLRDKQNLRECSGTSIFYAFIDLAVKGLTLATGAQALCYLIPRSVKVGTDQSGKDIWEKVCNLTRIWRVGTPQECRADTARGQSGNRVRGRHFPIWRTERTEDCELYVSFSSQVKQDYRLFSEDYSCRRHY